MEFEIDINEIFNISLESEKEIKSLNKEIDNEILVKDSEKLNQKIKGYKEKYLSNSKEMQQNEYSNSQFTELKQDEYIPFIDLFCGAGGLSLGLEQNKFKPVFALDFDLSASRTYLFNRPFVQSDQFYYGDIKDYLSKGDIPKAPVIVGGPPCQGFSNANRQRLSDDPRNTLYKDFILCVERSGASICLIENVPGMIKVRKQVERDFEDIGFMVKPFLFNAKDFGYPQNRNRVFWLGIKTDNILLFNQISNLFEQVLFTKSPNFKQFNLGDAIGDLPTLEAKTKRNATELENDQWGYTIAEPRLFDTPYSKLINNGKLVSFLFNHRTKYNNNRDIEIYRRLLPGEKSDAASIQDIMPYKNRSNIFKDKYFKLEPDKPSKTITAHMYYDCHMYIHPNQARGLTPREAARVQGFPDDYLFLGKPNEWYRQIGNAVSPLVARHVGRALYDIYMEFKDELL